jgi:8-hydroxy-5-deazaflavin:NADPH oxidoreductase
LRHSARAVAKRLHIFSRPWPSSGVGFNHLVAATLATDPVVEGGHRVIFLSSDDEGAIAPVAELAKQLGFAPVALGKLNEGGALVHARGKTWGRLIFQDLFKKQQ